MTELGPRALPEGRHGEHLDRPMMTWVPPELIRQLTIEANRRDLSRSAFVRRLLTEALHDLKPAAQCRLTRQETLA